MKSPISSVLMRFFRFSQTLFSWPARTWTTYHCFRFCSSVMLEMELLGRHLEEPAHDQVEEEIPTGDVAAHEQHGDDDDRGRVGELFVFLRALLFRVPGPGGLLELAFNVTDEIFGLG